MPITSPDSIYFADTTTPTDLAAITAAQATSVQAALARRSRYSYSWNNAAERLAQTGMVTGSTAYQIDTKTEYVYESGSWRLKTPHAEFTASITNMPNNTVSFLGNFTLDAANSTSSTFVTTFPLGGYPTGGLLIADPGVYAISSIVAMNLPVSGTNPATGRTFLDLSKVYLQADQQRVSIAIGEERGSISKPNFFSATPGATPYFQMYRNCATTNDVITTRISITRIG